MTDRYIPDCECYDKTIKIGGSYFSKKHNSFFVNYWRFCPHCGKQAKKEEK